MKKVFDKIIKNVVKTRTQIAGIHYTNNKLEVTDSHIAIIEEYKEPLNIGFDFIIGLDGKPKVVNYPDLDRIVPFKNTNNFVINIPLLESIAKLNKKEIGVELSKYGNINGSNVGHFENLDRFDHITISPKLIITMCEYLKESGQKKEAIIRFDNSPVRPAVIYFEEQNSTNIFILTPIRTKKDMKA
mgnify:CR=1 FL=1